MDEGIIINLYNRSCEKRRVLPEWVKEKEDKFMAEIGLDKMSFADNNRISESMNDYTSAMELEGFKQGFKAAVELFKELGV